MRAFYQYPFANKKTSSIILHLNITNIFKDLEAEINTIKITEAGKHCWPVAVCAAVLYFLMDKQNKINQSSSHSRLLLRKRSACLRAAVLI